MPPTNFCWPSVTVDFCEVNTTPDCKEECFQTMSSEYLPCTSALGNSELVYLHMIRCKPKQLEQNLRKGRRTRSKNENDQTNVLVLMTIHIEAASEYYMTSQWQVIMSRKSSLPVFSTF